MNVFKLRTSIRNRALVSASRSGGPGGQNVNKLNTRITLRLNITELEGLMEEERARLRNILIKRLCGGGEELVVTSNEERYQYANKERAFRRMEALITSAARLPKVRRATKPGRASVESRLETKKLISRKKERRRNVSDDFT